MTSWHDIVSSVALDATAPIATPAAPCGTWATGRLRHPQMGGPCVTGPQNYELQHQEHHLTRCRSLMKENQPGVPVQDIGTVNKTVARGHPVPDWQHYSCEADEAYPATSDYWQTARSIQPSSSTGDYASMFVEQEGGTQQPGSLPCTRCHCSMCNRAQVATTGAMPDEHVLSMCNSGASFGEINDKVQELTGVQALDYLLDLIHSLLASCPRRLWQRDCSSFAHEAVQGIAKLVLHQLDEQRGCGSSRQELLESVRILLDELVSAIAPVAAVRNAACIDAQHADEWRDHLDIGVCDLALSMVTQLSTLTCGTGLPTLALLSCTKASLVLLPMLARPDAENLAQQRASSLSQPQTLMMHAAFAPSTILLQGQQQLVSLLEADCYPQVAGVHRLLPAADHIEMFTEAAGNIAAIGDLCSGRTEQQRPALQVICTQAQALNQSLLDCLKLLSPQAEGDSERPETPPPGSTQAGIAFLSAPKMRKSQPPPDAKQKRKLPYETEQALGETIKAKRPAPVSSPRQLTGNTRKDEAALKHPADSTCMESGVGKTKSANASQPTQFWSFDLARKYVQELKLGSNPGRLDKQAWLRWCKSGEKPDQVPTYPNLVYADKWKSWRDWFGGANPR